MRAAFLLRENKDASPKQCILNHALVSPSVTDAEYRALSLELKFTDSNGAGCFLDPENGAGFIGKSRDKYERALKRLIKKGWGAKQRRYNKTSVRSYQIAPDVLRASAELFELMEQRNETAEMRNQPESESADLRQRNRKNADITPFFLTPVVEEDNTLRTREDGCGQEGLQLGQGKKGAWQGGAVETVAANGFAVHAYPLQNAAPADQATVSLETVLAIRDVANAWHQRRDPHLLNPCPESAVAGELSAILKEGQRLHLPAEVIGEVILEAKRHLDNKVKAGSTQLGTTWDSALSYFRKYGRGQLRERYEEQRKLAGTEAILAEKTRREEGITERTKAAFDKAVDANAAKRIAAPAKPNSNHAHLPAAESTPGRFKDDLKVPGLFLAGLTGKHLNRVFDKVDGATMDDIEHAAEKERPTTYEGKPRTIDEIISSVCQSVRRMVSERRDAELKAKYGEPDQLCGGEPHPKFKSEWVCISTGFVESVMARCPDIRLDENNCWDSQNRDPHLFKPWMVMADEFKRYVSPHAFNHEDYGNGLQARVEAHLEKAMLAIQAIRATWRRGRDEPGIASKLKSLAGNALEAFTPEPKLSGAPA
ncbi:MAG: hypothetical protein WBX25_27280 [Rhodomicrobium sp.]